MTTKSIITAIALCSTGVAMSACMQQTAADLPPGTYESESKTTNRAGTDVKTQTETNVGYDAYGNKTAVVKTKKTTDPKGLFNKSTTESTTVVK